MGRGLNLNVCVSRSGIISICGTMSQVCVCCVCFCFCPRSQKRQGRKKLTTAEEEVFPTCSFLLFIETVLCCFSVRKLKWSDCLHLEQSRDKNLRPGCAIDSSQTCHQTLDYLLRIKSNILFKKISTPIFKSMKLLCDLFIILFIIIISMASMWYKSVVQNQNQNHWAAKQYRSVGQLVPGHSGKKYNLHFFYFNNNLESITSDPLLTHVKSRLTETAKLAKLTKKQTSLESLF